MHPFEFVHRALVVLEVFLTGFIELMKKTKLQGFCCAGEYFIFLNK